MPGASSSLPMRTTSGEGGGGAGVGSQGSLLVTFLHKSDPREGSRGVGWVSECGAGTPLRQGHRLVLVGGPVLPPPCVLHPFYQPGMGSRDCNGGATALG